MSQLLTADRSVAASRAVRKHRERIDFLPYLLVAPIALLLLCIIVYPLIEAIRLALTDASLLRLAGARFIGMRNFYRLFEDRTFLDGLWRTLRWDAAVVISELAIAIPIALFLHRDFPGRGFVRAAVMVPYITPPAVVGLLFLYMFDGNFGVINDLAVRAGLQSAYIPWMSDPTASFVIVVAAMVWFGTPLLALILLAALQTIPTELYEAAEVDGASLFHQFWSITLPHIMPSIMFLALLRTIWMSNHIDMIFVMTTGGPGFSNYTEAIYSFQLTNEFRIGYASAVAVMLSAILMVGAALYVRHLARHVLSQTST